jgi:hypothetical protein
MQQRDARHCATDEATRTTMRRACSSLSGLASCSVVEPAERDTKRAKLVIVAKKNVGVRQHLQQQREIRLSHNRLGGQIERKVALCVDRRQPLCSRDQPALATQRASSQQSRRLAHARRAPRDRVAIEQLCRVARSERVRRRRRRECERALARRRHKRRHHRGDALRIDGKARTHAVGGELGAETRPEFRVAAKCKADKCRKVGTRRQSRHHAQRVLREAARHESRRGQTRQLDTQRRVCGASKKVALSSRMLCSRKNASSTSALRSKIAFSTPTTIATSVSSSSSWADDATNPRGNTSTNPHSFAVLAAASVWV